MYTNQTQQKINTAFCILTNVENLKITLCRNTTESTRSEFIIFQSLTGFLHQIPRSLKPTENPSVKQPAYETNLPHVYTITLQIHSTNPSEKSFSELQPALTPPTSHHLFSERSSPSIEYQCYSHLESSIQTAPVKTSSAQTTHPRGVSASRVTLILYRL